MEPSRGPNDNAGNVELEYIERDPEVMPRKGNRSSGIYDMPKSSSVYTTDGRCTTRQGSRVEESGNNPGWSMTKTNQTAMTILILLISCTALGVTVFGLLKGNVHFRVL